MKLMKRQKGASMIEYAILVAVMVGACLMALNMFAPKIAQAFTTVGDKIINATK